MILSRLGRVAYGVGLELQGDARARVLAGGADELLLLEHEPVVTLGRRGGEVDAPALERLGCPLVQSDRGGLATWHGPGQLVGYPIVDLKRARLKVPAFVDLLGGALLTLVQEQGVQGALYDRRQPGVYVEGQKLAAIGLHISRGVSTHGFALNVGCDLAGFEAIVPCGLRGVSATTLERALDRDLDPLLIEERIGVLIGQALGATPGPPP